MDVQSTPTARACSRAALSDTKLTNATKRKCTLDFNLPQVSTRRIEATTSFSNDEKVDAVKTPKTFEAHRKTAFSTSSKHKLDDATFSAAKRFKKTQDERMIPMYKDYQLLGDSQFVRFSKQLLDIRIEYTESLRRIGYCVSGQKIEDLRRRLRQDEFGLHTNVAVLIGTNDIVHRTDYQLMCASYVRLVRFLKSKCSKIILLTIPPVAKLENNKTHWHTLENFNKFILRYAQDDQVGVIDLSSVFISYCNTVSMDYYEKAYFNPIRMDLIHLNEKGLKMLQFLFDLYVFENRNNVQLVSRQLF